MDNEFDHPTHSEPVLSIGTKETVEILRDLLDGIKDDYDKLQADYDEAQAVCSKLTAFLISLGYGSKAINGILEG